jgi:hypothetical protein
MPRPKKEVLTLEQKLEIATEALKFYASKQSWKPSDAYHTFATITDADLKYYPADQTSELCGGKLEVDTLARITDTEPTGLTIEEIK